mmetsp:Transcript_84460/g.242513  ORF Transcript_84460/g.242513 Transcript_84460/m.242513 type:complete len:360 (+) Transcript_84460:51-1130(+)
MCVTAPLDVVAHAKDKRLRPSLRRCSTMPAIARHARAERESAALRRASPGVFAAMEAATPRRPPSTPRVVTRTSSPPSARDCGGFGGGVVARKVVFLVRHGEAVHNIEEKKAQQATAHALKALGLCPKSDKFKALVEDARRACLSDCCLRDAALSDAGKNQALSAKEVIHRLTHGAAAGHSSGLPFPTVVLTSPLERTLQTTNLVFPSHPNVHMCEALRERRTGLPCDERKPAKFIRRRPEFRHMSSNNLLQFDLDNDKEDDESSTPDSSSGLCAVVENKEDVRARSSRLAELLQRFAGDQAVAVVTHKGYLRELERGPLGRPQASEFGNGEVRVYELSLSGDGKLISKVLHGGLDATK